MKSDVRYLLKMIALLTTLNVLGRAVNRHRLKVTNELLTRQLETTRGYLEDVLSGRTKVCANGVHRDNRHEGDSEVVGEKVIHYMCRIHDNSFVLRRDRVPLEGNCTVFESNNITHSTDEKPSNPERGGE